MTDTGRVPGEGQPGRADVQPEAQQPHPTAAHGAYVYADPEAEQPVVGDDEDLLMPNARSGWSDGQSVSGQYAVRTAQQPAPGAGATAQSGAPRRPLHLGPPVPEQSGAVRTLADRGPTAPTAPSRPAAPVPPPPAPEHVRETTAAAHPEYPDVPQGADAQGLPGPQLGELPSPAEDNPPGAAAAATTPEPTAAEPVEQAPAPPLPGPDLAAAPDLPGSPQPVPETAPAAGPEGAPGPAVPQPGPGPDHTEQPTEQQPTGQEAGSGGTPVPTLVEAEPQPSAEAGAAAEPVPDTTVQQSPAVVEPEPATPAEDDTAAAPDAADGAEVPSSAPAEDAGATAAVPGEPAPAPDVASPDSEQPGPQGPGPEQTAEANRHGVSADTDAPLPHQPEAPESAGDAGVPSQPSPGDGGAGPGPAGTGAGTVPPAESPGVSGPDLPQEQAVQPEQSDPADAVSASPGAAGEGAQRDVEESAAVPGPRAPEAGPATAAPPTGQPASEGPAQPAGAAPDLPTSQHGTSGTAQQHVPASDGAGEVSGPGGPDAAAVEQTAPPISDDTPAEAPASSGDAGTEEAAESALPGPEDPAPAESAPTAPAPGYDEAEREAVHRLMRERRDVRNGFRPDPIPHDVLLRVLEAAHTAPSVGHSQPWDFVVIRSEETRRTMHELAMKQREAYAESLPKARAKQFKELKVEAILDTPVNIVVTADPTRGGRHTLGRQTQPQMAPYSSALAVENLWLAARAEGLGVGWVSFFDEREMVRTLELPEHLEVVAYLCIGYVDEFPAEPELMQAGWSRRRPLSWVVHEESYGRRALPGAEPHDLLAETLERLRPLDAKALGEAWERQKRMTKPAGALGMLEIISAQLCGLSRQCPPPVPEPAAVAVFAGDHGVHAQGVTPWPQEVTAQMVGNFLGGGAVCNAFAHQVGAEVCVIDVGVAAELPATPGLLPRKVRPGTADMTCGPALTQEEVLRAVEVGIETARDLVTAGNKALVTGEMGIANTTASAALIAACTGSDPAEVTGRGTGIDDETHTRKVDVVRRALELHRPDPADPVGMLAAVGGLEHAALTGLILGGASLRTPVILDGVSAGAAALVARQIAPEALAACIAGHRSAEPGHVAALTKLGLRPLIDLDMRLGEGTGALLALPMVQSAARAMHQVATFDSAGVTEKN